MEITSIVEGDHTPKASQTKTCDRTLVTRPRTSRVVWRWINKRQAMNDGTCAKAKNIPKVMARIINYPQSG